MNLSEHTVHTHRQHIMDKLDLHSVAALTTYAVTTELTTLLSRSGSPPRLWPDSVTCGWCRISGKEKASGDWQG